MSNTDKKLTILTVDDDLDILEVLKFTLEEDFNVVQAASGKEALEKLKIYQPDLLVLDYMLPDTTGVEICKSLRSNPLTLHLPILMLTGKGEIEDKITGLNMGADDYMIKPFSPDELLARINMLIRRSTLSLDANPLTRLPGNITINRELSKRIENKEKFAVLYMDLDNFKAVNDYYGFDRGDMVIKEFSRIVINATQTKGTEKDFIGHIGGDDFVVITSITNAEPIAKEIINLLDKKSPSFYDPPDREKGFIETKDRTGSVRKFPFITVSIGIISNKYKDFSHVAQISSLGAEIKEFAKQQLGSTYVFDRRASE